MGSIHRHSICASSEKTREGRARRDGPAQETRGRGEGDVRDRGQPILHEVRGRQRVEAGDTGLGGLRHRGDQDLVRPPARSERCAQPYF